ncbi:hypothetical protein ABH935_007356 [Catenulispora sp. GAS73]|uniref:hypothetical protein n=1 Tax=Catenulispora sp. GAS73 TaxID=3156269 RepID=UPI0035199338
MHTAIVNLDAPTIGPLSLPPATVIVDTLWLSVLGRDGVEHIHVAPRPHGADALFFLARDADPEVVLAVCRRAIAGTPWLAGWNAGFEMASATW